MTTPRIRALVSLAAALPLTLVLGACAPMAARTARVVTAPATEPPLTLGFVNDARVHVHVYLVDERREWLLGRVEPGARAMLRIPDGSLASSPRFVRLAVLAGERLTQQAAGDARTAVTIPQPASALASQRWTYSHTTARAELTPLGPARPRTGAVPW